MVLDGNGEMGYLHENGSTGRRWAGHFGIRGWVGYALFGVLGLLHKKRGSKRTILLSLSLFSSSFLLFLGEKKEWRFVLMEKWNTTYCALYSSRLLTHCINLPICDFHSWNNNSRIWHEMHTYDSKLIHKPWIRERHEYRKNRMPTKISIDKPPKKSLEIGNTQKYNILPNYQTTYRHPPSSQ